MRTGHQERVNRHQRGKNCGEGSLGEMIADNREEDCEKSGMGEGLKKGKKMLATGKGNDEAVLGKANTGIAAGWRRGEGTRATRRRQLQQVRRVWKGWPLGSRRRMGERERGLGGEDVAEGCAKARKRLAPGQRKLTEGWKKAGGMPGKEL